MQQVRNSFGMYQEISAPHYAALPINVSSNTVCTFALKSFLLYVENI